MGFFSSWLAGIDEEDINRNATIISGLMLQHQNYELYQGSLRFLGRIDCQLEIKHRGSNTWDVSVTVLALRCIKQFYTFSPVGPVKKWLMEIAKMYKEDPLYFEDPVEYRFQ